MKKLYVISFLLLIIISCSTKDELVNTKWTFIACEGNYGSSNGSIYMINQFGLVDSITGIGDVVQSVKVKDDKLFVIVNNSHKIIVYDISSDGIAPPGIHVSTNDSSPREMVIVNDKLYFTNWNSMDIKYLDLINYKVNQLVKIDGLPEDILHKNNKLYFTINMNENYSSSDKVLSYDLDKNEIEKSYNVGKGPLNLAFKNNDLFISNTYYDESYNAYHGTSMILENENIIIKDYGKDSPCGGSIHNIENIIYRSAYGGIVEIDENLEFILNNRLGDFTQSEVYSIDFNNDKLYFGLTDYNNKNEVKVLDINSKITESYNVGIIPGDFAFWNK